MGTRALHRSFSSGELTPELFGRVDLSKAQEGLALCQNFQILPHGPAVNRPGTLYVQQVKNIAVATRVIPFTYNSAQAFAIQMGAGYFRFHFQGTTLGAGSPAAWSNVTAYVQGSLAVSGGVNYYCILANTNQAPPNATYWYAMPSDGTYEIPNPYAAADLFDIHFVQSSDVLTLVHPGYAARELRRVGATNWQLVTVTFAPPTNTITAATLTANIVTSIPAGGNISFQYAVTTVAPDTFEESPVIGAGTTAAANNNLNYANNTNTVTWTDSSPGTSIRYNVYRLFQGTWAYVGQATSSPFTDNNITPDSTKTPPLSDSKFSTGAGYYPASVSYFEQRRCFAGTTNLPQNFWATKSGTESNMTYTIPTLSDNRLAFRIAAREASAVRHIVPVSSLILLTASCEFVVTAPSAGGLSPSNLSVRPQSYIGANNVQPIVVGNTVLFAAARGGHIREMSYDFRVNGYLTNDIAILAPHLFDYNSIVDMTYCKGPIPTLWCVSSSGKLLGMTYVPEQQIAAWHQHVTGNTATDGFESVCCITENNEDVLYAVVRRTLSGTTYRFIEQLHTRLYATLADSYYVDCGAQQTFGSPVTTVSGLSWLNGQTVNILADGAVVPPQVVTSGSITLPHSASKVAVGLPIVAKLQTMPVTTQTDPAAGQGVLKNVNKIYIRVYRSSGIYAGPDFTHLTPYRLRSTEPYGSPPNLISDLVELILTPTWGQSGQVCIQQTDPLPLDVSLISMDLAVGG
jgi:hypothetical protein